MINQRHTSPRFASFEQTARQVRWASIGVILITFPWHSPQGKYAFIFLVAAALFNLSRHSSRLVRIPALGSPIATIAFDTFFTGALIALASDIGTPYSGLLIFMLTSAAYLYHIPGTIVVTAAEITMLFVVAAHPPFAPITLSPARLIGVTIFVLLALGFYMDRLTRSDRIEHDTLEKLRANSELERSRLHTLVDSLDSAIFVTDGKRCIVQYNEAARILVGSSKDLTGQEFAHVVRLCKQNDPKAHRIDPLQDAASTQHRRDLCLLGQNDTRIELDMRVTQVATADGDATESIIICKDISQERSLEMQRSEFISVASHELRTPLAILEGALASALSTKELPAKVTQLLEQAHRNSRQLAGIIKDLTILAEAQNDNIPVDFTRIDAGTILNDCVMDFAAQAEHKGITLKQTVAKHTPSILSTEHHIREVLQNFMTNALKYSDKGTITLRAEPAQNGGILFSVQDEGVGISPANQSMLFTKFFRAEDYRTRSTGGSGLGLYLCMELANRLGAKLWCKSTLNKGSTFFLEVPEQNKLRRDQREVMQAQVANMIDDL